MQPHLVELRDFETNKSILIDMEGPYHEQDEKIGEHIYGAIIYIEDSPYHLEKYIPTEDELLKFRSENEGDVLLSKDGFLYRIVPFTK